MLHELPDRRKDMLTSKKIAVVPRCQNGRTVSVATCCGRRCSSGSGSGSCLCHILGHAQRRVRLKLAMIELSAEQVFSSISD